MRLLRYDVPPGHRLVVDGELVATGGETFEVSDELAERLLTDRHVPVAELMPEPGDEHTPTTEEDGPNG